MKHSFIETKPDSHFPIQNLPYGIFHVTGESPWVGTAIGEYVLDLSLIEQAGLLNGTGVEGKNIFSSPSLNPFMALGRSVWSSVRSKLQYLLDDNTPVLRDDKNLRDQAFHRMEDVTMLLPAEIGDFRRCLECRVRPFCRIQLTTIEADDAGSLINKILQTVKPVS